MDAEALATALLPDPANPFSQSGADFFFRESARTLIVGLLDIVRTGDPADIPKLLGLPRAKLKEAFRGIAAEALIDPGAHEQGAGIVATAFNATKAFRHLPREFDRQWSAVEWARIPEGMALPQLHGRFARGGFAASERLAGLPGAPFDGGAGISRTDLDYRRRVADSETAGATRIAGCARTQTGSLRGPRLSGDHPTTRPLWARSDRNDGCCAGNQADSSDWRARHCAMVERSDRRARSKPDPGRRQCRPTRGPRRFHDSSAAPRRERGASQRDSDAAAVPGLSLHHRPSARDRGVSLSRIRSCDRQDSSSAELTG